MPPLVCGSATGKAEVKVLVLLFPLTLHTPDLTPPFPSSVMLHLSSAPDRRPSSQVRLTEVFTWFYFLCLSWSYYVIS